MSGLWNTWLLASPLYNLISITFVKRDPGPKAPELTARMHKIDLFAAPTTNKVVMDRPPKNAVMIGLFTLAVVVHAAILLVVIPEITHRLHASYNSDLYADGYDQLAENLVNGNGYRMYPDTAETLMREPGYPIFLAGIYYIFGNNFAAVKSANMMMAFVVAWLMMWLSRQLSNNRVMILGPPLLFLFHPGTLIAESRGGIELLYTLFLTFFMCTLYAAVKRNRVSYYVGSGVVLGLTVLVRSVPILFPLAVLGYLLVFERQQGTKALIPFRNAAVMIGAMLVVLCPWIIRNYRLTGKFVPTASVVGVSAQSGEYIFTHHSGNDRWVLDGDAAAERNTLARKLGYPFKEGYYQCFYSSADELKFSNYLIQRVAGDYKRSPSLFIRVIFTNLVYFWVGGKTGDSVRMNCAVQLPVLILAVTGILLSVKSGRLKIIAPMMLLIAYSIAVSLPILAQARYSVPMIPYLSILAFIPVLATQKKTVNQHGL
jgi:4-amino-4-deoxy-L-arabinose transferase-like glycosyltransferase